MMSSLVPATAGAAEPDAANATNATIATNSAIEIIGAPPAAKINEPYAYTFAAGGPPGTKLMAATKLPPGFTFDPATGVLAGTPSAPRPETHTFAITAYHHSGADDEWPQTATRYFQLPFESTTNYTKIGNSSTQITYRLGPLQTINHQDIWCPAKQPYLINSHVASGRIVPHGVQVIERGFDDRFGSNIGVSADTFVKDGFQAGVKAMSMTNGNLIVTGTVTITLHCTNNQDDAQRA